MIYFQSNINPANKAEIEVAKSTAVETYPEFLLEPPVPEEAPPEPEPVVPLPDPVVDTGGKVTVAMTV